MKQYITRIFSKKEGKVYPLWMFFLSILFCILLIGVLSEKVNYHVDEIYSYGLSNNRGSIRMDFKTNKKYTPAGKAYMNYVAADPDDRFHYDIVWENQTNDVHPPLYYCLLHTISSLRPGTFSKWYAGAINILFALLTLYMIRRYSMLMYAENKIMQVYLPVMVVASAGIVSAVAFLRMYIVAMFWVTLLEYVFAKEVEKDTSGPDFYAKVYGIAVLGALTHYYCIIFTVLLCGVYCVIMLLQKKYKTVLSLIATGILAAGTAVGIFPAMIKHMFFGYRGRDSMNNLSAPISEYWERLRNFFDLLNVDLFGGKMLVWILAGVVFLVIATVLKKEKMSSVRRIRYALLFIPCILYFFIISKMAVYFTTRYMTPIYAILLVGIWGFGAEQLQRIGNKKVCLAVLIVVSGIITGIAWKTNTWRPLYKESKPLLEASENYRDLDCIYVYDKRYMTHSSYMEVKNYNSVRFARTKEKILRYKLEEKQEIIVMITQGKEEFLDYILQNYPQFTHCDPIGSYNYTTTYHLYADM